MLQQKEVLCMNAFSVLSCSLQLITQKLSLNPYLEFPLQQQLTDLNVRMLSHRQVKPLIIVASHFPSARLKFKICTITGPFPSSIIESQSFFYASPTNAMRNPLGQIMFIYMIHNLIEFLLRR